MVVAIQLAFFTFAEQTFGQYSCNHTCSVKTPRSIITWKRSPRYWPFVGECFPHKAPIAWSFDISFDVSLNVLLYKHLSCRWFETPLQGNRHVYHDLMLLSFPHTLQDYFTSTSTLIPMFLNSWDENNATIHCKLVMEQHHIYIVCKKLVSMKTNFSEMSVLCLWAKIDTYLMPRSTEIRTFGHCHWALICAWTNGWENFRKAGDLRRHRAHYDVTVKIFSYNTLSISQNGRRHFQMHFPEWKLFYFDCSQRPNHK